VPLEMLISTHPMGIDPSVFGVSIMKVVFEGLLPEQAASQPTTTTRVNVRAPKKSRVQLRPIAADARLFHAFYA
jgi:hypothetical protein